MREAVRGSCQMSALCVSLTFSMLEDNLWSVFKCFSASQLCLWQTAMWSRMLVHSHWSNSVSLGISAAGWASLPRNVGVWRLTHAAVSHLTITEIVCVLCTHLTVAEKDYSEHHIPIFKLVITHLCCYRSWDWNLNEENLLKKRVWKMQDPLS